MGFEPYPGPIEDFDPEQTARAVYEAFAKTWKPVITTRWTDLGSDVRARFLAVADAIRVGALAQTEKEHRNAFGEVIVLMLVATRLVKPEDGERTIYLARLEDALGSGDALMDVLEFVERRQ